MALDVSRRSLITGLVALVAAPAIVRVSSIMPVKAVRAPLDLSVENVTWTVAPGETGGLVAYRVNRPGDLLVWLGDSIPVPCDRDLTLTFQQGKGSCHPVLLT